MPVGIIWDSHCSWWRVVDRNMQMVAIFKSEARALEYLAVCREVHYGVAEERPEESGD